MRNLFEADAELKDWGIDTRLIGSYARLTARYPGKDVDVFLRCTNCRCATAEKIYNAVERVPLDEYGVKGEVPGGRITPSSAVAQDRVPEPEGHFSDDAFAIDAVPAVPLG